MEALSPQDQLKATITKRSGNAVQNSGNIIQFLGTLPPKNEAARGDVHSLWSLVRKYLRYLDIELEYADDDFLVDFDSTCARAPRWRVVAEGKDALVVGALGAWDTANKECLRALGIGQGYATLFRKLCAADAIKGSHAIWRSHRATSRWHSGVCGGTRNSPSSFASPSLFLFVCFV